MTDSLPRLSVRPDEILPGDRFTPRRGPYSGHKVEVVDVLRGRYSVYRVVVRLLEPVELGVDYNEIVQVERAAA